MKHHDLKTHPEFFAHLLSGNKMFECRKNDREFQQGDVLVLREYDPINKEYTGRFCTRIVTYIMRGPAFGLADGYCVMSVDYYFESKKGLSLEATQLTLQAAQEMGNQIRRLNGRIGILSTQLDRAKTLADDRKQMLEQQETCSRRLWRGIQAVEALIKESHGVAGLHKNGDVAPWEDLRTGGRYDTWLIDFDEALNFNPDTPGNVDSDKSIADALAFWNLIILFHRKGKPHHGICGCDDCKMFETAQKLVSATEGNKLPLPASRID